MIQYAVNQNNNIVPLPGVAEALVRYCSLIYTEFSIWTPYSHIGKENRWLLHQTISISTENHR